MKLGIELGGDDDARRYRQTRLRYLIACLVCTTALGAVIAGAILAVNGGRAALSDESLVVGVAVVFALLAASVVVTAVKTVHWSKRVRQRLEIVAAGEIAPAADTWVPPGSGEATHDGLDLAGEIPRLRGLAWRAAGIAGLWVAALVIGIVGVYQLSQAAERLLDTGTKVTGWVHAVTGRGASKVYVDYPVGNTERRLVLTSHEYHLGQPVTVIYDPADPGHPNSGGREHQ
jgi:hypothetical protein